MGALRVFAANEAMVAGLPRELRRYIGRWANEETADVYVRDTRVAILKGWELMMEAQDKAGCSLGVGKEVPLDLGHREYDVADQPPSCVHELSGRK